MVCAVHVDNHDNHNQVCHIFCDSIFQIFAKIETTRADNRLFVFCLNMVVFSLSI